MVAFFQINASAIVSFAQTAKQKGRTPRGVRPFKHLLRYASNGYLLHFLQAAFFAGAFATGASHLS